MTIVCEARKARYSKEATLSDPAKTIVTTYLAKDHDPREALQACFQLRVLSGPFAGTSTGPLTDSVSVGSSPTSGFRLQDPSISRHHIRIDFIDDGVKLTDLGSTNGTYVGGVQVSVAYLAPGSVIRLGQTEISFELTGKFASVPISEQVQFGRMYGQSLPMRRLFAVLERAATTRSTCLIEGESGTGKELIAEALHEASPWSNGPLVVVDCGCLPPSLIESELFGHERGAFTGAYKTTPGAFERAHGGTIFLDEIGELDITFQSRLLRALENRRTRRVGGNTYHPFEARIVAATNRDLQKMVSTNDFREDLYHRLSVIRVRSPSLRQRAGDIEPLARIFLSQMATESESHDALLTEKLLRSMRGRTWPGNVRELRNYIERLVVLGAEGPGQHALEGTEEHPEASPDLLGQPYAQAREMAIANFEMEYARQALERTDGNVAKAAREIGIDRVYLFRLIRKHGLRKG